MDSFNDLFRNLSNSPEIEEILATFDQDLRPRIVYDALAVLLIEDGGFTPGYAVGGESGRFAWFQTRAGESVLIRAAQEHRPVLHPIRRDLGRIESALIYPIEHDLAIVREVTAVLILQYDGDHAFSNSDLEILQDLGPKLAVSIENARRYPRSEQRAEADPLSGVANVRSLFQRLDAELARARRRKDPLAVLQCSMDGFDRSGRLCSHGATRNAFEKVALKLRDSLREYDFTARSGDDLVLVLPGFQPEYLAEKREAIKRTVEETGAAAGLPLFAAVGAAFYPEDGSDAEDLLAVAANKLVVAKRSMVPTISLVTEQ